MIYFFIIVLLFIIAYQDIRYRRVYLWAFLGLIFFALLNHILSSNIHAVFYDAALNLTFIGIQALLVWGWFQFRKKPLKEAIGSGDLLLILAMAIGFKFEVFIYLYLISLMVSVVLHLLFINKNATIPLAGFMSICWICYIGYHELNY